jgi:hypothetical protein
MTPSAQVAGSQIDPVVRCIVELRNAGAVRCGFDRRGGVLEDVVRRAGLRPDLDRLRPIDAVAARRIAIRVLHRDLAYQLELMERSLAEELADRFFQLFGDESVQYYTNGTFDRIPRAAIPGVASSCSWLAMTEATFDTGILVLGWERSGYLWVEDED